MTELNAHLDSSPAEVLRAAARMVRETAAGTTPTPWRVHVRYYRKSPDMLAGAEFETPLHTSGISLNRPHVLADNRWKALMSPAVAPLLAAWLEGVAKDIDGHNPNECCECTKSDSFHDALAFARLILGGRS